MKNLLVFIGFCFSVLTHSQESTLSLKTYSFKEIEQLQVQSPRPLFVIIYADWCNICTAMDQTTFKNQQIITVLNSNFYTVRLHAEEKQPIRFLNKTYNYIPTGKNTGWHQLARYLATTNKRSALPTHVILDPQLNIKKQLVGYYKPKKLNRLLKKHI